MSLYIMRHKNGNSPPRLREGPDCTATGYLISR